MPGLDEAGPSAGGDMLDDLYNYDSDDADAAFKTYAEKAAAIVGSPVSGAHAAGSKAQDDELLEEVIIAKPRAPVAKLDVERFVDLCAWVSKRGLMNEGC